MTISIRDYCLFLDETLNCKAYSDASLNGLQIESEDSSGQLKKVAFAVDAAGETISAAAEQGANLLVVHHGLLWGGGERLVGLLGSRVRALFERKISLYAAHLPLDGDLVHGNAAGLADLLGLREQTGYCDYRGMTIGLRGKLEQGKTYDELFEQLMGIEGAANYPQMAYGAKEIETIAIVTGSGSLALEETANAGIDLLISGEPKHESYQSARDLKQSAIFAGHYATELFGVKSLQGLTDEKFKVETCFLSAPSGL